MEILQGVWKQHLRPRAVVGYGIKIFFPSPQNYVTRSPGYCWMNSCLRVRFDQYTVWLIDWHLNWWPERRITDWQTDLYNRFLIRFFFFSQLTLDSRFVPGQEDTCKWFRFSLYCPTSEKLSHVLKGWSLLSAKTLTQWRKVMRDPYLSGNCGILIPFSDALPLSCRMLGLLEESH